MSLLDILMEFKDETFNSDKLAKSIIDYHLDLWATARITTTNYSDGNLYAMSEFYTGMYDEFTVYVIVSNYELIAAWKLFASKTINEKRVYMIEINLCKYEDAKDKCETAKHKPLLYKFRMCYNNDRTNINKNEVTFSMFLPKQVKSAMSITCN